MRTLDGQVALVTGAGSGIGRATALALAAAGARVTLVARSPEPLGRVQEEVEAAGGEAWAAAADVADAAAVERVVAGTVERWGRLDVLVNNAGMNVPDRALDVVSVADWEAVVKVNLTGTFLFTRAALPVMRRQGSGTVVNISSTAGHRTSPVSGPAYSAAKAAVNSFTESVNQAERRHGIRACAVCPGEVATPILDRRPVPPSAEQRAQMLQPEDLAQTVLLVASLPQRAAVEYVVVRPTAVRPDSP